jgi:hypothetical protein
MVAPFKSAGDFTLSALCTMKPVPSYQLVAGNSMPSWTSRWNVTVVTRDRTSISPVHARRGRERHVPDLVGVSEYRGGNRATHVDVQTAPVTQRVGRGEAGDAGADAALDEAFAPHAVERGRGGGTAALDLDSVRGRLPLRIRARAGGQKQREAAEHDEKPVHLMTPY